MAKPKLGLSTLTDNEIIALATTIVTAMTGNANFNTPNPTLASVTTAKTTAQTKVAAYNSARLPLTPRWRIATQRLRRSARCSRRKRLMSRTSPAVTSENRKRRHVR